MTGLPAKPWWILVFEGLPYADIHRALTGVDMAPDSMASFPSDWRLAVSYNGT
ncbi:hypothetical protein ACFY3M_52880 [Streptomyces mirabilis]|uniref:hypothetical protein n=1 Tax=Streptomyces mirabilis TaxID=68239 RepID=UPI0036741815